MQKYGTFTHMTKYITVFLALFMSGSYTPPLQGQTLGDKPAYRVFSEDGLPSSYDALMQAATNAQVILWGELHNNPIAHWLNYELGHDLFKQTLSVGLSFEQFELDQQAVLDSVMDGDIPVADLAKHTRTWPNYPTDYQPLIQLGYNHSMRALAANVPRSWARAVAREGLPALDSLSPAEKALLPPLPLPVDTALAGYRKMAAMMGGHGGSMSTDNLIAAQALKDAVMAWRIAHFYTPGTPVLHTVGAYHVTDHSGQLLFQDGIQGYLRRYAPQLQVLTVVLVEQHTLTNLDAAHVGTADFIIVVPDAMTKSY